MFTNWQLTITRPATWYDGDQRSQQRESKNIRGSLYRRTNESQSRPTERQAGQMLDVKFGERCSVVGTNHQNLGGSKVTGQAVKAWDLIRGSRWKLILNPQSDLRFVKKFTRPNFRVEKFYTIKVRKLWLFLLKKKQSKCIDISYFSSLFVRI